MEITMINLKGISGIAAYQVYLELQLMQPTLLELMLSESNEKAFNELLVKSKLSPEQIVNLLSCSTIEIDGKQLPMNKRNEGNFTVEQMLNAIIESLKACGDIKPSLFF
jgi:hypothetical protein